MVNPHSPKAMRESEMESLLPEDLEVVPQHPSRHSTPEGATQGGQSKVKANNLKLKEKNCKNKTKQNRLIYYYLASIIYH